MAVTYKAKTLDDKARVIRCRGCGEGVVVDCDSQMWKELGSATVCRDCRKLNHAK